MVSHPHSLAPDPGEVAVDEIGPDFPLQRGVAPALQVLEREEAQHHFGRRPLAATGPTLRMPPLEGRLHEPDQGFILQQAIDREQPLFQRSAF